MTAGNTNLVIIFTYTPILKLVMKRVVCLRSPQASIQTVLKLLPWASSVLRQNVKLGALVFTRVLDSRSGRI